MGLKWEQGIPIFGICGMNFPFPCWKPWIGNADPGKNMDSSLKSSGTQTQAGSLFPILGQTSLKPLFSKEMPPRGNSSQKSLLGLTPAGNSSPKFPGFTFLEQRFEDEGIDPGQAGGEIFFHLEQRSRNSRCGHGLENTGNGSNPRKTEQLLNSIPGDFRT